VVNDPTLLRVGWHSRTVNDRLITATAFDHRSARIRRTARRCSPTERNREDHVGTN